MKSIKVSVLLCTYNRPDMLQQALTALIDNIAEKPDEVIVVNGGNDREDHIVENYGNYIHLIKTININLATSRNIGLKHCTGEIVAMTDDDAEVHPDWITQIKHVHAEYPNAGAIGGAVIGADDRNSFLSRLAAVATFPSPSQPQSVRTVPGVNVSYKQDVLSQIGPQDETLFRGEDVDFNWRVKKLGYDVLYHPDIKVTHHHRPTIHKFLYQHYMYGRAYYLVRRKWPDMYCVYPHGFHQFKDFLKFINFWAAIIYEPLLFAQRMPRLMDKLLAIPILLANQIAWKSGMTVQMIRERLK